MPLTLKRSTLAVMERRSSIVLAFLFVYFTVSGESTNYISDKTPVERCSTKIKRSNRNSFLWTLKEYPYVYLFGTIHRPYTTVWPMVPRRVKRAFKSSRKVYFEIDFTNTQYLLTIMKCELLPNKQNISMVLPPVVLAKLRNYLDFVRSQMPSWMNKNQTNRWGSPDTLFEEITRNLDRKRPIWMLLQLASLNKDYVRTSDIPSMDSYLFLKATRARKKIGNVETAKEHCGLNSLNTSQAILYLNMTLTKYNLVREGKINLPTANELTYHYLCGNLRKYIFPHNDIELKSTPRPQAIEDFEKSLTEELLLKRNQKMAENIIKEIQAGKPGKRKKMFFAIGAGHFLGNGSILDILEANGFKTKHVKAKDSLPRKYKFKKKKFGEMSRRKHKAQRIPTFFDTSSSSEGTVRSTERWMPSRSSARKCIWGEILVIIVLLLTEIDVIMVLTS